MALMTNCNSAFVSPRYYQKSKSFGTCHSKMHFNRGCFSNQVHHSISTLERSRTCDVKEREITTEKRDDNEHADIASHAGLQRRQFLFTSAFLMAQIPITSNALGNDIHHDQDLLSKSANYQRSPINKRSGITLSEPERIYPINFITYLSRFLLVFDPECQAWWYRQASAIPAKSSKDDVDRLRLEQFGQFAASVEVGLVDFEGDRGPGILLQELVKRYADITLDDAPINDTRDPFASFARSSGNSTQPTQQQQQKIRKKKEALRQIALMFSLLKEYQPVDLITQLLAADDEAKIENVIVTDGGAGYLPPDIHSPPKLLFPDPPTLGTVFMGSVAQGRVVMKESGRVLRVDVINGGSGYTKPPTVEIGKTNSSGSEFLRATAKAILGKGKLKGCIERIDIVTPGLGYSSMNDVVTISPPDSPEGEVATAKAILEYQVAGVDIIDPGKGYATERPISVLIDPPPHREMGRPATAISYPRGRSTSFKSFITIDGEPDNIQPSDAASSWVIGPTSQQLLTLLPSGFGLEFDTSLKRYVLSSAQTDNFDDSMFGTLEGMKFKPLNPIFGFRGRSPIEREKSLDAPTVLSFIASGAVCSSVAHLVLTPIDVVKTKVQTKPEIYNGGIVETFKKVLSEEGAKTFFDGWEPTFVGFFFTGGVSFAMYRNTNAIYCSYLFIIIFLLSWQRPCQTGSSRSYTGHKVS
jgi:hypothetical protein